jgi:2,4-dienoyl-CoA reductase-like NADH-dependent reductase (Old Yellow Enzyme family)
MTSALSTFDPITIGPLTLRNRFIKSGANEAMCLDGKPTRRWSSTTGTWRRAGSG